MGQAHRLGEWGERTARVFLEQCGYFCFDQRYRRPGGEIDLVMGLGRTLVFVEVKTRGAGALAPAEAWLRPAQLRRLRRTALHWLNEHPERGADELRFDLVAVDVFGPRDGAALRHFVGIG